MKPGREGLFYSFRKQDCPSVYLYKRYVFWRMTSTRQNLHWKIPLFAETRKTKRIKTEKSLGVCKKV